ncbi:hypothetical protein TIFTF001_016589 [Ficus carica]|uniref:Uncharacterized protein n=1 Tax=Ficus carica TaxID=3494 RepID=A0AA88D6B0_FICCA|nr:hypothetical protein TIFTF001_016589 [Ficus carica]
MFIHWRESNEIARYNISTSMTSALKKQHETYQVAMEIMDNLEDMFRGQEKLVRRRAITTVESGAELDYNTQIEMVFKILSNDFVSFKAAYNLGDKELGVTEFIRQLQAYKLIINDGVLVQSNGDSNLAEAVGNVHLYFDEFRLFY